MCGFTSRRVSGERRDRLSDADDEDEEEGRAKRSWLGGKG